MVTTTKKSVTTKKTQDTKAPGWLAAPAAPVAPTVAPAVPGKKAGGEVKAIVYKLVDSETPAVAVVGSLKRSGGRQMLLHLPPALSARLESMMEGGAISSAAVGLIQYALDELDNVGKRLVIRFE